MKRRFLALFLAAVMVFGMLPTFAMAEETQTPAPIHFASRSTIAASVDGELAEPYWSLTALMSGSGQTRAFGSMWDTENLYLAVKAEAADTELTVTFGDTVVTVSADGTVTGAEGASAAIGSVWEIKLPRKSVGIHLTGYEQSAGAMTLSMGGCTWEGELCFTTALREQSTGFTGGKVGSATNFGTTTDGSTMNFYMNYDEAITSYENSYRAYQIKWNPPSGNIVEGYNVLEFDFRADKLPEFDSWNSTAVGGSIVVNGMVGCMVFDETIKQSYTYGITNLKDQGLTLVLRTNDDAANNGIAFPLNAGLEEDIHIRLEYFSTDKTLRVYANGVYLGQGGDPGYHIWGNGSSRRLLEFNLYTLHQPTSAEMEMDFTVSNVTSGSTLTEEDVLSALTFDTIKGENTVESNITKDLTLPETVSHVVLGALDLVWSSSDETVISAAGAVSEVPVEKTVTLTAALKYDTAKSKTFTLTVPASETTLFAGRTTSAITVDGETGETDWLLSGAVGSRNVGAMWDKDYLYLAAAAAQTDTALTLTLNGVAVTVAADGTVTGAEGAEAAIGSVWEIKLPRKALDIAMSGYEYTTDLTVSVGEDAWEGKLCFSSATRSRDTGFSGGIVKGAAPTIAVTSDGGTLHYTLKYDESVTSYLTEYRAYQAQWDPPGMVVNDGINVIEFDFVADKMPEFDSWNATATDLALVNGFVAGLHFAKSLSSSITCGITNLKDLGLSMVFRTTDADSNYGTALPLNVELEETAHIRLEYDKTRAAVKVYCNGAYLGEVGDLYYSGWVTNNQKIMNLNLWTKNFQPDDPAKDIDFTVSNICAGTTLTGDLLDALTFDTIKGQNAVTDHVIYDLNLIGTLEHAVFGDLELVWSSSDETVVAIDGTVTPAVESKTVTLTASLKDDPTQSKSFTVTVVGADPVHLAARTAAVTVDGEATEADWWLSGTMTGENAARSFGMLWDHDNLYLLTAPGEALTLTVNGVSVSVAADGTVSGSAGAKAALGSWLEVCIPRSALNISMSGYEHTVPMAISMGGCTYEGDLCFSSASRTDATGFAGAVASGDASSIAVTNTDESLHFTLQYNEAITSYPNQYRAYQATWSAANMDVVSGSNVMEFDFVAEAMPEFETWNSLATSDICVVNGMVGGIVFNWSGGHGYTFGISNLKEMGLSLVFRTTDAANNNGVAFPLGVELGETAHIRLEYNSTAKTIAVYCNDMYLGEAGDLMHLAWTTGRKLVMFNLYTTGFQPTSEAKNMDFTVSNVATGITMSGTLLDALTFDDIRGKNLEQTAITHPLVMGSTMDHPVFGDLEVVWSSTDESIISTDGKIAAVTEPVTVTVTAALKSDSAQTKSFELTVVPFTVETETAAPTRINAAYAGTGIVLDGLVKDEGWLLNTKVLDAGSILTGEFGVQWDEQYLYLALDPGAASDIGIVINEVDVSDAEQVKGSILTEYRIPLSELGITVDRYDMELPITVTLDDSTFAGTVVLTSIDWWAADNYYYNLPVPSNLYSTRAGLGGEPTENQGIDKLSNGWRMYDLYDPNGENPMGVRSYVAYMSDSLYRNFDDRSETMFVQFDFQADAMPVYDENTAHIQTSGYANYGFSCSLSDAANAAKCSNVVLYGIYNSADGLIFVARDAGVRTVKLNKQLGDLFRIGIAWESNGDVTLYIDGEEYASFPKMSQWVGSVGNCSFLFNLYRNTTPAASEADSFDLTLTNVAFGRMYGTDVLEKLTFADIAGKNEAETDVIHDLELPAVIDNGQASFTEVAVTWSSSDPAVIDPDTGKVTRPETGGVSVTLTATLADGSSKSFTLMVRGQSVNNGQVLVATNDRNPAATAGVASDELLYTFDTTNNSLILDLGESKQINVVRLTDTDEVSRINAQSLTLWVSEDNASYTRVEDFKLLHKGADWYLYDFAAAGRYVKVHYTHFDFEKPDFVGILSEMIDAYAEDVFGAAGTFTNRTQYTVTNTTDADALDAAWRIEGAAAADARVYFGEEALYHYTDGEDLVVRIPEIAAGASVVITVLSGCEDAMDIANKEAVHEVTYGTQETFRYVGGRWLLSLEKGMTFPDGSVLAQDLLFGMYGTNLNVSYDGGYTWSTYTSVLNNAGYDYYKDAAGTAVPSGNHSGDGGWIVDWNTGRIMYQYHRVSSYNSGDLSASDCRTGIIFSDDGGKTWNKGFELPRDYENDPQSAYVLSYSDGVMLSTYDGPDGNGIDFVFNMGAQHNNEGGFCGRVAYSRDAGQTWTFSESVITYGSGSGAEGGISEISILEKPDGTLILYARCQFDFASTLAKSYSYDHGVTWTTAVSSTIYSSNTQPVMMNWDMNDDGSRETPMIFWAGNNALGGASYRRAPLSVGQFAEDLESLVNLQNLFYKTPLDCYTAEAACFVTNPSVQQINGDGLYATFARLNHGDSVALRVDDFDNWFNRTKGAYDSFEGSTLEAEGWEMVMGSIARIEGTASDGNYSMQIAGESKINRSVPYLQDGTVSLDLYLDGGERFTLELQAGYSDDYNHTAPISLTVENGVLTFEGTDTAIALHTGWNTVEFKLALTEGKASASVNGGSEEMLSVNLDAGDYVCYIAINTVDEICVDNVLVVEEAVEIAEVTEPAAFYGANMKLSNDLSMNFFIEAAAVAEATYAEVTFKGETSVIWKEDWIVDGSYYKIAFTGMAAKEMTEEMTIQLFDADGNAVSEAYTDSIRTYAMRILVREDAKASDKTLMVDMLNYGAAAQTQFTYKTDDLANALLTDEQKAYATETVELTDNRDTGVNYYGTSLNLKTNIQMNVYFTNVTADMTARISYTNHNGEAKAVDADVVMSGSYGKVTVESMVVADAYALLTVEVLDSHGNVVARAIDSVESYCYRTMAAQPLNEYLMKFAQSAWNSFHS